MRKFFLCLGTLFLALRAPAQNDPHIKVLLLGVFHFDNPGLDVAKFDNANILSQTRQTQVLEIVQRLKNFSPDKIFIESTPENQNKIDSIVRQFKDGTYTLRANEIDQLGLRLAKELNLPTLYAADFRDADFPFDSLMKSAAQAGQTVIINRVQKMIDSVQASFNNELKKSTIAEMLIRENTPEAVKLQNEFYLGLLPVGVKGNHVGSYLVSEWWRRNMIIYENVLKRLDNSEKKIIIIFGSGHTALLSQLMHYNSSIELVDIEKLLK